MEGLETVSPMRFVPFHPSFLVFVVGNLNVDVLSSWDDWIDVVGTMWPFVAASLLSSWFGMKQEEEEGDEEEWKRS